MSDFLLALAVVGPAVAAVVWAALTPWRWPRRVAGSVLALAAHSAAWAVFWLAYRGEPAAWRSLEGTLLGASVLVAAELGVLLVALRADGLGPRASLGAIPALGVSATAVAFAAFSTSLVVQAMFVPAATIAAAVAGLSGTGRRHLAGVLGLALADVACLGGLAIWVSRLGSVVVAPAASFDVTPSDLAGVHVGTALVLVGAAIKTGAVPGMGTWRLAATDGPGAPVSAALRGQGVALAVLAGVVVGGNETSLLLAGLAAGAAVLAGIAAAASTSRAAVLTAVAGVAACVPFFALGLGGAVGARAFFLSFPPFLLASGAAFAVAWEVPEAGGLPATGRDPAKGRTRRLRSWIGVPAALAAVMSLASLPAGGGHPGTALALDLAGLRGQTDLLYLAVAVALMLGLGLAVLAAAPAVAAARPPLPAGIAALVAGGALLYMGTQPVRLGVGWWLRLERSLDIPGLLASSGAPAFPAVRGPDLLLVLGPAAGLALLVGILGRGVRAGPAEVRRALTGPRAVMPAEGGAGAASGGNSFVRALSAVRHRFDLVARPLAALTARLLGRARRLALGLALAALLEAGAVALSVYLVGQGVRLGFL